MAPNRIFVILLCVALTGCAMQRSKDAETAQHRMVGMTKEQVLTCMGPPRQRDAANQTEVWSYLSTDATSRSFGASTKSAGNGFSYNNHTRNFCTVNVVMVAERVTAIHYNGPRGGPISPNDQCAFAVEHCVKGD